MQQITSTEAEYNRAGLKYSLVFTSQVADKRLGNAIALHFCAPEWISVLGITSFASEYSRGQRRVTLVTV